MSKVFICYRRDDSGGYAHAVHSQLVQHFSKDQVFMDVDTVEPGVDFVDVIQQAVGECDVLVALIGKRWVASEPGGKSRLDNTKDYVRLEVSTALARNIRVIPVLVDGMTMPDENVLPAPVQPITRRNALELSNTRFNFDVERLSTAVRKIFDAIEAKQKADEQKERNRAQQEAEQRRLEAEAERKAEEERLREQEKQRSEEEARRKAEEENRRRVEEERKLSQEAEQRRLEAEAERKAEEERLREQEKQRSEEEARRKAEEENRRRVEEERKLSQEAKQRRLEAEAERKAEEERLREQEKQRSEEEARRKAEGENRRRVEEERKLSQEAEQRRLEAEAEHKAEEERLREQERQRSEEQVKRKAEEEKERNRAEREAEQRRLQAEALRQSERERIQEQERKRSEEEAKRTKEEKNRLEQEAEQQRRSEPRQKPQEAPVKASSHSELLEKIKEGLKGYTSSSVFVGDAIPADKIANAIDSYAQHISPEDVLLLYDNTFWGGAKDGMMLTTDAVYWRNINPSFARKTSYADIQTVDFQKREYLLSMDKIMINQHYIDFSGTSDAEALYRVISYLMTHFKQGNK